MGYKESGNAGSSKTPIVNSYWVRPGRLLAGEYPAFPSDPQLRVQLRTFLEHGVDFFVDLTQEGELDSYLELLREEAAALGREVGYQRFAIVDMDIPSELLMRGILDTIDAALDEGRRVYVHCWGGIGRTGTVVGCHLVRHGLEAEQAIAEIARLRQGTNCWRYKAPATEAQRAFVRAWRRGG